MRHSADAFNMYTRVGVNMYMYMYKMAMMMIDAAPIAPITKSKQFGSENSV